MLLLSLSSHLQLLLVGFLLVNGRDELIQLGIAHTFVDFAGVEVLNTVCGVSTNTPAGEGAVVLLRAHHGVELGLRLVVLLELNTCCLELLLEVLELSQRGCIRTEVGDGEACSLAVLGVVVAGLGVACCFQDLCRSLGAGVGRHVVLVALLEGHSNHGAGQGLFPVDLAELDLSQLGAVNRGEDCTAQGGVGHAGRVELQVNHAEALAGTNLDTGLTLDSVVGCQASKANAVQLAILERCALCLVAHFTPDNAVQQRLLTPPLVVGHEGEGLSRRVPLANLEGAGPVLIHGLVHEAVVEELLVGQCGVQTEQAEGLSGVQGLGHDDLDAGLVAIHGVDGRHLLPEGSCDDVVAVIGVAVDGPRGADCLNVNGGAVVEDSLRVELEGDGLHAANGLCLVVADIVVVEAVFASRAQGGEADSGGDVAGATECGEVRGGVAALSQNVEVRADCRDATAELATLLEGGAVLLVNFEVLDDFLGA